MVSFRAFRSPYSTNKKRIENCFCEHGIFFKENKCGFFSNLPPRDNLILLPTEADFFLLLVNPILCKKATKNQLGGNTLRFLSDFLLIYVTLCKVSYAEKKGLFVMFLHSFLFRAIFRPSHF